MKLQIVYTETITREMTKEIEMTKAEYKEFLKMNKSEQDRKYDFCGECSDEQYIDTTIVSIYSEVI
jgi:hypothetical protein